MSGNITETHTEKLTIATLSILVLGAVMSLLGCVLFVATRIAELASSQLARGVDYVMFSAAF